MNEKENVECKWLVDKSGDLFLTRRRRSLRRAVGYTVGVVGLCNYSSPAIQLFMSG